MKRKRPFKLTFADILGSLFVLAAIVWGIPWILDFSGLSGYPEITAFFEPGTRWFFGLLFAGCVLVRALLYKHGFLAGLFRLGLLVFCLLLAYQHLEPLYDLALQQQQPEPEPNPAFVPDLHESDYVIQNDGLPPVAVIASLGPEDIGPRIDAAIFTLPDWLLNQAKVIYIMEDARFDQELSARNIEISQTVAGFSNYSYTEHEDGQRTSNEDSQVFLRLSSLDRETVAHELTHCWDFAHSVTQRSQDSPWSQTVLALYDANPNAISLYGAQNVSEFFAEAGALYLENPDDLYNRSPEMYGIFSEIYGPAEDLVQTPVQ